MSGGSVNRPTIVALGVGVLCAAAVAALGIAGEPVMPSYLGAWLFLLALPLGALPILMGCELLDVPETALTVMLRRLAAVMPLAAVLALPVLFRLGSLYPSLSAVKAGLPGWWMTDTGFVLRTVLFLAVWTALSSVFSRPDTGRLGDARRPVLAGLGLGLHLVMGTLAAFDWAQEVEPSFMSSAFGLLLISAQCSVAVSTAVLMAVVGRPEAEASHALSSGRRDLVATEHVATALAVLLGAWGFMVFTQYLVVWSANLPKEVVWYQHRSAGVGLLAEYCAGILCALALVALLPRAPARHAGVVAWVAAALLVMHGFEMLWLVTPAFRSAFTLTPADIAAVAAAAGLGIGGALLFGDRAGTGRVGHGAT